ncbi:hypothetical protein P4S72_03925 [Vibrio sp. PP-XX7]
MLLLGRRPKETEQEVTPADPSFSDENDNTISIGDANVEDSGAELDELILDEDLFSTASDKDDDDTDDDENDVFAELEDVDPDS